jgi:hypothetical protein
MPERARHPAEGQAHGQDRLDEARQGERAVYGREEEQEKVEGK